MHEKFEVSLEGCCGLRLQCTAPETKYWQRAEIKMWNRFGTWVSAGIRSRKDGVGLFTVAWGHKRSLTEHNALYNVSHGIRLQLSGINIYPELNYTYIKNAVWKTGCHLLLVGVSRDTEIQGVMFWDGYRVGRLTVSVLSTCATAFPIYSLYI